MSPDQCRAARALLGISQTELSRMSNVADITIRSFERRQRTPIANNLSAIRRALEDAGVEFIGGEREGVRFAKSVHVRGDE